MALGVHVGSKDRINAGLVAWVAAKPVKKIGIEPYGDCFLGAGHHNLSLGPESFIRRVNLRVFAEAHPDL